MIKSVLFVFIIFSSLANANASFDYNKYLKSETRAQIKLQKLVDDEGDYAEAIKFGKTGLEKYQDNIFIMSYYAKAMYLTGGLDKSKKLFMKMLSIDPTNDIAAGFIKKIEDQEEAKKNKDLAYVIDYLTNKGFDFLMIFLGFLGAEVLAKRYNDCKDSDSIKIVDRYIAGKTNGGSIFTSIIKRFNYISFLLQIIIVVTIAIAISIVLNWLELSGHLPLILSEERLQVMNGNEFLWYFIYIVIVVSLVMVLFKFIGSYLDSEKSELDVANELQTLALENKFEILKECVDTLDDNDLTHILEYCVNKDAQKIIVDMDKLCKNGACTV